MLLHVDLPTLLLNQLQKQLHLRLKPQLTNFD
nr:MAG TPA: hypothetical protein [Caudoviricetes sp.]